MSYNQPSCRACGAAIIFANQRNKANSRPNPLCASPRPEGNLRLIRGEGYDVLTGDELQKAKDSGEPLYLSHFANCPKRASFKKHVPGSETK